MNTIVYLVKHAEELEEKGIKNTTNVALTAVLYKNWVDAQLHK